jgi:diaminohydroxyphosphoribosylaminopyrimidine deaminase/5-amino-6-(5-phosphoribosylamino)uracil reductase
MSSEIDIMHQVLRLAARGRGGVEPNPMVGCIIVKDGQIIGRGYHQRYGGPHAEPLALDSCRQSPRGGTAYVNLEPCCHLRKQTPPCVPRLIEAGLARVVVGCPDPNPNVNGQGIAQLRAAAIAVEDGVLVDQATQLNAAYFKRVGQGRPYVTLKWAQTADGKIAGPGGRTLAISGAASRRIVHRLRARCDAIMVGIGTVLKDNPLLTARRVANPRPLLRIVVDSNLRIPVESRLCQTTSEGPVLVGCSESAYARQAAAVAALSERGVEVIALAAEADGGLSLAQLLDELGRRSVTHLLVEPGPKLADGFLRRNLADRVWISRSDRRVDDDTAPSAAIIDWPASGGIQVGGDQLTEYLNPKSEVFFTTAPSADLVLEEDAAKKA